VRKSRDNNNVSNARPVALQLIFPKSRSPTGTNVHHLLTISTMLSDAIRSPLVRILTSRPEMAEIRA